MTLTLMPSAMAAVMAGRPSSVAGILISAFGRSTASHSVLGRGDACASVSWARSGSTSIETRPSTPGRRRTTGARTSQALRTSSVVSSKTPSSTSAPVGGELADLVVVALAVGDARAAKIVGLVVTPDDVTCP